MASSSKIEWTDATWNPVTGCTKVSPGCANCYAERDFPRYYGRKKVPRLPIVQGINFPDPANPDHFRPRRFTDVEIHPDRLDQPLGWKRPRKIFVNSLSDLFHEDVGIDFIQAIYDVMQWANHHTFQVLTKRSKRMAWLVPHLRQAGGIKQMDRPLPNLQLGVSVEDSHRKDRIRDLRQTPAAVRFLSLEPLLGPPGLDECFGLQPDHDWRPCLCKEIDPVDRPCIVCEGRKSYGEESGIHWVIVGGESGPNARAMHPAWVRSVRDLCQGAGIPFFFKQWGEWMPVGEVSAESWKPISAKDSPERFHLWPDGEVSIRIGKKAAGRMLDGRTWDEFPERRKD